MSTCCATNPAFDQFRKSIGSPRQPPAEKIANNDEIKQISETDGLKIWADGSVSGSDGTPKDPPPFIDSTQDRLKELWAVRQDDVVSAQEMCEFGKKLETGKIKHTNLTGGAPAFSGGELIRMSETIVAINGCSGRYGPRTPEEMHLIEQAFAKSGYHILTMGYDQDANRPLPFVGVRPRWVERVDNDL